MCLLKRLISYQQQQYLENYNLYVNNVTILEKYDKIKKELVETLKEYYDCVSKKDRKDFLVPYKDITLKTPAVSMKSNDEYYFEYKWNSIPGNQYSEFSKGKYILNSFIKKGDYLDRFGSSTGTYVCPCNKERRPYTISERALPYYTKEENIEDEMAYHLYIAKCDISIDVLQKKLVEKHALFSALEYKYLERQFTRTTIISGEIAPVSAFGKQGSGMGYQYRFPVDIDTLIQLDILEEVYDYEKWS